MLAWEMVVVVKWGGINMSPVECCDMFRTTFLGRSGALTCPIKLPRPLFVHIH